MLTLRVIIIKRLYDSNNSIFRIEPSLKTITISLPAEMGKEIEKVAKEEHRTVSELLRETSRQYRALRNLKEVSQSARKTVKKRRLTPKDMGGPFES
jgi:Ribbon-helix-helix protein, copG family